MLVETFSDGNIELQTLLNMLVSHLAESIDHVFIISIISLMSADKEPTVCLTDVVVNVVNIESLAAVIAPVHSARRCRASQISTSRDLFRHHAAPGTRLDAMALRSTVATSQFLR